MRHFQEATGEPLPDVVRMASLTPADRVGVRSRVVGKRADVLVLSKGLGLQRVFVRGLTDSRQRLKSEGKGRQGGTTVGDRP